MNVCRPLASLVPALLAVAMAAASASAGGIIHVDDDAPPGGDGTSWETAFRFLRDALDLAAAGDVSEIRVGQGVQLPDRNEANPGGTQFRQDSFALVSGVALRGGYAGFGAMDPDARDVENFTTLLHGDLLGNDGPDFENYEDNSFQIVVAFETDATAVLDGFTVRAASAAGLEIAGAGQIVACRFEANLGTAVSETGGSPDFIGCVITGNRGDRGAGMTTSGAPTLTDCDFQDNVGSEGAAIFSTGSIRMTGCSFLRNESTIRGPGAVEFRGTDVILEDCLFEDNRSAKSAGAVETRGGAITDCAFRRNSTTFLDGGAIVAAGSLAITRCDFEGNSAPHNGGAVHLVSDEGSFVIIDSTFRANTALRGGGVYARRDGNVLISGCTFSANVAESGAGVYNDQDAQTIMAGCRFEDNRSTFDGAGVANFLATPEITECVFIGNEAARDGGGVANLFGSLTVIRDCVFEENEAYSGGEVFNENESEPVITGSSFARNRAVRGAGMANESGTRSVILDCTFLANAASSAGGGMANTDAEPLIVGCRFLGNTATGFGGGMAGVDGSRVSVTNTIFSGNTAIIGGGVRSFDCIDDIVNCTFSGNDATFGPAVSNSGGSTTLLANCILWNHGSEPIDAGATVSVRYSDVEGGHPGVGNIAADPLFVDPLGPDALAGTFDDDLRLLGGSPAIDAGDNGAVPAGVTLDLDGTARFVDDPGTPDTGAGAPPLVDMGAYEFAAACTGDVDGDGNVGFSDVLAILAAWGPCEACAEDIDGDGIVGFAEILIVLGSWGPCP